jgi:NADPH:quinone reductase-like Zn-dependent oxidoreductase
MSARSSDGHGDVVSRGRRAASVGVGRAGERPSSGLTALQALDAVDIARGDHLVVVGAAGMVGGLVTQIAASRARVIMVVSPSDEPRTGGLGAHTVLDRNSDLPAGVRDIYSGGLDDTICAARGVTQPAIDTVRSGGRFATITDLPEPPAQRGIEVEGPGAQRHGPAP